jgi:hypothetical protein
MSKTWTSEIKKNCFVKTRNSPDLYMLGPTHVYFGSGGMQSPLNNNIIMTHNTALAQEQPNYNCRHLASFSSF